jgi:glycosyltransferase involved in cell wall biosynthesis
MGLPGIDLRVCLVSSEVFEWGYHGGFGFLTRTLGRLLVKRGVEVSIVTPRRGLQTEYETLDGIEVHGFPVHKGGPSVIDGLKTRLDSIPYYRKVKADIYHSQALSYNTYVAEMAVPGGIHAITFQDPYDIHEWRRISQVDRRYRLTPAFMCRLFLENQLLSRACSRADALFAQARFLVEKARKLFRLRRDVSFLPNPVEVPSREMVKSDTPTVCFLGRWDPQKRVERFMELALEFPEVEFVAMGRGHDPYTDARLRERYTGISNLELTGFVSEDEKSRILERSWALVNTSVREALPVSFLEALAHETPIISGENPDGLTAAFGHHVVGEDYAGGLRRLLRDETWLEAGKLGRRYVENVHEAGRVVDRHLEIYRDLLEGRR